MNITEIGLSIIIPVYNASKYIGNCLRSVVEQIRDYNVEVICVDDGSIDGSAEIIQEYININSNVRYIYKDNEGSGAARNLGVLKAVKKYVSYLDADDYYEDGAIDKIFKASLSGEKIFGFAYWSFLDNHDIRKEKIVPFPDGWEFPTEGRIVRYSDWQNDYGYTNFIFERDFLISCGIQFPQYRRYQDPVFFLKALCTLGNFRLFSDSIYVCRIGYKSSEDVDKGILDVLFGIRDNMRIAYENRFDDLRKKLVLRLNNDFYESIYRSLSDDVMAVLLEISDINNRFDEGFEIKLLRDLYDGRARQRISEKNYKREQEIIRDYCIFNNVTKCMKQAGGFSAFLEQNGIKKVCVYGAGLYGRLLVQDFILHGMEVVSVVDKCEEGDVEGIPIMRPDKEKMEYDLLIIALRDASNVEAEYRRKRAQKMISLSKLTDMMILNQFAPGEF